MKHAGEWLEKFKTRPDGRVDPAALRQAFDEMSESERRRYGPSVARVAKRDIAVLERERRELENKSARLKDRISRYEGVRPEANAWLKQELRLEPANGSALHQLRQALASDTAIFLGSFDEYRPHEFDDVLKEANCFVVEHDWGRAFDGAGDFAEGEIRLPYDACVFEFRISGARLVALMGTVDETVLMQLFVRLKDQWVIDDDIAQHVNGRWELYHAGRAPERNTLQHAVEFVGRQVRAICVALDAEIAETAVVRVPEKFARAREKAGKAPPLPYHVISLARRTRCAPIVRSHGAHEHGKVRLHFRRGHWRHYEDHKTWIKWMLVGNPDLGFVDKEYRL